MLHSSEPFLVPPARSPVPADYPQDCVTITPGVADTVVVCYWDARGHVLTEHRLPRAWVTEDLADRTLAWARAAQARPTCPLPPGPQLVR